MALPPMADFDLDKAAQDRKKRGPGHFESCSEGS